MLLLIWHTLSWLNLFLQSALVDGRRYYSYIIIFSLNQWYQFIYNTVLGYYILLVNYIRNFSGTIISPLWYHLWHRRLPGECQKRLVQDSLRHHLLFVFAMKVQWSLSTAEEQRHLADISQSYKVYYCHFLFLTTICEITWKPALYGFSHKRKTAHAYLYKCLVTVSFKIWKILDR